MIFESSLELCLVSPSAVMMRCQFFQIKGYFDETLPACEDYDLWLRTATDMPIFLVDQPCTIKQGGHSDQLSSAHSLDKYRIQSIEALLKGDTLSPPQPKGSYHRTKEKICHLRPRLHQTGKLDEGQRCFDREAALPSFIPIESDCSKKM